MNVALGQGHVRNFGVNLLRGATFIDDSGNTIIATSLVGEKHLEVALLRWSAKTGQVGKLLGPSIRAFAPRFKPNSHIRDIAWAPKYIKFSDSVEGDSRALAVVAEEALFVFEVTFAIDKTVIEKAKLVSTIDVNALVKSNNGEIPANICSTITHVQWHPSALPSVFLFRPKGAPVRVTIRNGSGKEDQALLLNLQNDSYERSHHTRGNSAVAIATLHRSSLLVSSSGDNEMCIALDPLREEAQASRKSRTYTRLSHVPREGQVTGGGQLCQLCSNITGDILLTMTIGSSATASTSSLRSRLDRGDNGGGGDAIAPSDSTTRLALGGGLGTALNPSLSLLSPPSALSSLYGRDIPVTAHDNQGKFRHVLSGESILSALSVPVSITKGEDGEPVFEGDDNGVSHRQRDLGILRRATTRVSERKNTSVVWRETPGDAGGPQADIGCARETVVMGKEEAPRFTQGILQTLMNIGGVADHERLKSRASTTATAPALKTIPSGNEAEVHKDPHSLDSGRSGDCTMVLRLEACGAGHLERTILHEMTLTCTRENSHDVPDMTSVCESKAETAKGAPVVYVASAGKRGSKVTVRAIELKSVVLNPGFSGSCESQGHKEDNRTVETTLTLPEGHTARGVHIQPFLHDRQPSDSTTATCIVFVYAVKKAQVPHGTTSLASFGSSSVVETSLLVFPVEVDFEDTKLRNGPEVASCARGGNVEQRERKIEMTTYESKSKAPLSSQNMSVADFQRKVLEELAFQREELASQRAEIASQRELLGQLIAHHDSLSDMVSGIAKNRPLLDKGLGQSAPRSRPSREVGSVGTRRERAAQRAGLTVFGVG